MKYGLCSVTLFTQYLLRLCRILAHGGLCVDNHGGHRLSPQDPGLV